MRFGSHGKIGNRKTRQRLKPGNTAIAVILVSCLAVISALYLSGTIHNDFIRYKPKSASGAAAATNGPRFPIDVPGSLWWIVNKDRPAPENYVPSDLAVPAVPLRLDKSAESMLLSRRAIPSLQALFRAASRAGFNFRLESGFRSYPYQASLRAAYLKSRGRVKTERFSARAGMSEHQTGLAADIGNSDGLYRLDQLFGASPAGRWLARHAREYGFIIRYPGGKKYFTGYEYEPWHLRFIGARLAAVLAGSGETMEEHFGLSPDHVHSLVEIPI